MAVGGGVAAGLGDQFVAKVDVSGVPVLVTAITEQQLALLPVGKEPPTAVGHDTLAAPAMAVVFVPVHFSGCPLQPVADVENVGLPATHRDIAVGVVSKADVLASRNAGQPVVGVDAVHQPPAADGAGHQVVQRVVVEGGCAPIAAGCLQTIQSVVGHAAVVDALLQVFDTGDIAIGVVAVPVKSNATVLQDPGQAAYVLRHVVGDVVVQGVARDSTIGEVADVVRITGNLSGLPQRIGDIDHRAPGVRQRIDIAVAVHPPREVPALAWAGPRPPGELLAYGQPPVVVAVSPRRVVA